jgi:prepilin-type N-terminal cleavage/methylation domain-containing protein
MRNATRSSRARGFTLVEIMVAILVSAVVVTGVMAAFVTVRQVSLEANAVTDVTGEARLFSDTVVRDLRMAAGVEDTFNGHMTANDEVILKIPSVNSAGEILDVISATDEIHFKTFDRVIYYHVTMDGRSTVVREVVPDAQSARQARAEIFGNLVTGDQYLGAFSTVDSATGASVLHFQLRDTDSFYNRTHEMPISGSVRLRNFGFGEQG